MIGLVFQKVVRPDEHVAADPPPQYAIGFLAGLTYAVEFVRRLVVGVVPVEIERIAVGGGDRERCVGFQIHRKRRRCARDKAGARGEEFDSVVDSHEILAVVNGLFRGDGFDGKRLVGHLHEPACAVTFVFGVVADLDLLPAFAPCDAPDVVAQIDLVAEPDQRVLRRLDHVVGRPVVVVAVEDGQGGVLALDRGDRVEVLFDRGGERHVLGGHRKFVEVFRAFIGKVGTRSIVVPHGADLEEGFGNGYRDLHGLAALRAFGGVDLEVFVIDNGDGIGGRCFRAGGDDKGYILIGHGETIREHRIPPPSDTGSHGLSL